MAEQINEVFSAHKSSSTLARIAHSLSPAMPIAPYHVNIYRQKINFPDIVQGPAFSKSVLDLFPSDLNRGEVSRLEYNFVSVYMMYLHVLFHRKFLVSNWNVLKFNCNVVWVRTKSYSFCKNADSWYIHMARTVNSAALTIPTTAIMLGCRGWIFVRFRLRNRGKVNAATFACSIDEPRPPRTVPVAFDVILRPSLTRNTLPRAFSCPETSTRRVTFAARSLTNNVSFPMRTLKVSRRVVLIKAINIATFESVVLHVRGAIFPPNKDRKSRVRGNTRKSLAG